MSAGRDTNPLAGVAAPLRPARPPLTVVATGAANLASVCAAAARLGYDPLVTDDPSAIESAEHVILPGVGTFGAAMHELNRRGLVGPLQRRLKAGRSTLCICLGLQLLAESSDESPGVAGLGIVPGQITRFDPRDGLRVPQLSWNRVTPNDNTMLVNLGWAYYANSYCLRTAPDIPGWQVATTHYGSPFVAAIQRGGVLACQFHPELSGPWGASLIERWLAHIPVATASNKTPYVSATTPKRSSPPPRIIPCLDVNNGRVVKGVQFTNLRDMGDPATLAAAYEAQGADELVVLDVSATLESRGARLHTIESVRRAIAIPLTVGGGVQSIDDAKTLLDAGADKVSVNSAAVRDPSLLTSLADRFGRQCVVIAIDAARDDARSRLEGDDRWSVIVRSGTARTALDAAQWASQATALGAGEVLLTSHDRDGTRQGYDLAMLRAVSSAVNVPVIASGGAHTPEHLAQALASGASAVLAASIFHDSDYPVAQIKDYLASRGVEVRT